jgi:hypothetical protein
MPLERLLRSRYTFPVKDRTSINQPNQFFHIFLSPKLPKLPKLLVPETS